MFERYWFSFSRGRQAYVSVVGCFVVVTLWGIGIMSLIDHSFDIHLISHHIVGFK